MSSRSTHPPVSRRERRAAERAERRPASDPARPRSVTTPRSVWRSPLVVLTVAAILVTAVAIG
ncbi:MAG TPA: hypothetical protein VLA44_02680, partial [Clostridia bacterium]|nr:hypothetical protein [Clostridia bacterium]